MPKTPAFKKKLKSAPNSNLSKMAPHLNQTNVFLSKVRWMCFLMLMAPTWVTRASDGATREQQRLRRPPPACSGQLEFSGSKRSACCWCWTDDADVFFFMATRTASISWTSGHLLIFGSAKVAPPLGVVFSSSSTWATKNKREKRKERWSFFSW